MATKKARKSTLPQVIEKQDIMETQASARISNRSLQPSVMEGSWTQ